MENIRGGVFLKKWWISLIAVLFVVLTTPLEAEAASFRDVPTSHWGHEEIQYLTSKGVIRGYANRYFKPTGVLTRQDAAVMLQRARQAPKVTNPRIRPTDVRPSMGGYQEIMIAVNDGMFTLNRGKFNPKAPLTREEMAKALAVAYEFKGNGQTRFSDVSRSNGYYKYIDGLLTHNITSGYSKTTYHPKGNVTRAQFSKFLSTVYQNPLGYEIKKNGRTVEKVRTEDEAVTRAVALGGTAHPVSNALEKYKTSFEATTKPAIRNGILIYNDERNARHGFPEGYFNDHLEARGQPLFESYIITNNDFQSNNASHMTDAKYDAYINRTFAADGALHALDRDAKALGQTVNVHIVIPYMANQASNAVREKRTATYVQKVENAWKRAGFTNIRLKGYYWAEETVRYYFNNIKGKTLRDEQLVKWTSKYLNNRNRTFIYSPHSRTTNFDKWKSNGFDAAYLQPNVAIDPKLVAGQPTLAKRELHRAFIRAQAQGASMNLEFLGQGGTPEMHNMYVDIARQYKVPSVIVYQANGALRGPYASNLTPNVLDFFQKR